MQRAEALRNLSREHNHALLLARTARRTAAGGDASAVQQCWESLARTWREEMAAHIETEERLMIPVLRLAGAHALAERLLREHRAIRRALADPARWNAERLGALAEVLRAHVRREEREAFPLVERHAGIRTLAALAVHPEATGSAVARSTVSTGG